MDLLMLVVVVAVIGFLVYLITAKVPMPPGWATAIQVLALVVLILFILTRFVHLPNILPANESESPVPKPDNALPETEKPGKPDHGLPGKPEKPLRPTNPIVEPEPEPPVPTHPSYKPEDEDAEEPVDEERHPRSRPDHA